VTLQDPLVTRLINAEQIISMSLRAVVPMISPGSGPSSRAYRPARRPLPRCPVTGLSVALLNRYLEIKQRGLL